MAWCSVTAESIRSQRHGTTLAIGSPDSQRCRWCSLETCRAGPKLGEPAVQCRTRRIISALNDILSTACFGIACQMVEFKFTVQVAT